MALWTFRTYVSPQGEEEVTQWYARQSPSVQAAFDQRLRILSQMGLPKSGGSLTPSHWRDLAMGWLKSDSKPTAFSIGRLDSMGRSGWNLPSR